MKKTRPDKLKRIFSLICSLILCIGVFSVLDLDALQAEAVTYTDFSNGLVTNTVSLGGWVSSYVIQSDPNSMIKSIVIPSSYSKTVLVTTNDNYTSSIKYATVRFYNRSGNLVATKYLRQEGKKVTLDRTSLGYTVPYWGGSYLVKVTANCRVTCSYSNINVLNSSALNVSGSSFGYTTSYGQTYTAQVYINVPTRLVQNPASIGEGKTATGGGAVFSAGRDCHPFFSWGQEKTKVTMTYAKNWLMSKDTVLTGQVPYPGTTVLYKVDSWGISIGSLTYIQTDDIDFTKGIKVVYNGNYDSGTSSATVATGTMYAWTENGDAGWVEIGSGRSWKRCI